jgi:hypothetical protein
MQLPPKDCSPLDHTPTLAIAKVDGKPIVGQRKPRRRLISVTSGEHHGGRFSTPVVLSHYVAQYSAMVQARRPRCTPTAAVVSANQ